MKLFVATHDGNWKNGMSIITEESKEKALKMITGELDSLKVPYTKIVLEEINNKYPGVHIFYDRETVPEDSPLLQPTKDYECDDGDCEDCQHYEKC